MLGVSFVPWIVIIFMVAMAFYDHWAVNGSKHMLTLADTMIDLKLPILLVAPKDKEYSFLNADEGTMVERDRKSQISKESIETSDLTFKPEKEPKKTSDAMFMGLGDVIFPGILVISAMSWLPNEVGFAGLHGPTTVAFGTLIGGLIGYMILMTQVARGKPQAGLPLLNGGSILGYLLTTILILGFDALAFNITLF
jgi:presenilin-like A22 family membrane protease